MVIELNNIKNYYDELNIIKKLADVAVNKTRVIEMDGKTHLKITQT